MKAYIFILILLVSCGGSQPSKKIPNGEDTKIARIDSTGVEGKIRSSVPSRKQSTQESLDTLGVPLKHVVTIPLKANKKR